MDTQVHSNQQNKKPGGFLFYFVLVFLSTFSLRAHVSSPSFTFAFSLLWTSEADRLELKELDGLYTHSEPETIKVKTRIRMPSTGVEGRETLNKSKVSKRPRMFPMFHYGG